MKNEKCKYVFFLIMLVFSQMSTAVEITAFPNVTSAPPEPDKEFYLIISGTFPEDCYAEPVYSIESDNNVVSVLKVFFPKFSSICTQVIVPFKYFIPVRESFGLEGVDLIGEPTVQVEIDLTPNQNLIVSKDIYADFNDKYGSGSKDFIAGLWEGSLNGSYSGLYVDKKSNKIILNPFSYDSEGYASWSMAVIELDSSVVSGELKSFRRTSCNTQGLFCQIETVKTEPITVAIEGRNQMYLRIADGPFVRFNSFQPGTSISVGAFNKLAGQWIVKKDDNVLGISFFEVEIQKINDFTYSMRSINVESPDNFFICGVYEELCYLDEDMNASFDQLHAIYTSEPSPVCLFYRFRAQNITDTYIPDEVEDRCVSIRSPATFEYYKVRQNSGY
ncbi:MAG: hypothetical protein L3J52_09795 [Proteobacteria bacterium]|nr:hypothetical protein [Pseudomonadota bacterium]